MQLQGEQDPYNIPECTETVRVVADFDKKSPWGKCEIRVFLIHFAIASSDADPSQEANGRQQVITPFTGHQSILFDPISALLATRESRAEIALRRSEFELCSYKEPGAFCIGNPEGSVGFFRNDIRPREWTLPLGWYLPSALYETIRNRSIDEAAFNYRDTKEESETDVEHMILYFDTALFEPGASPSISDKLGEP